MMIPVVRRSLLLGLLMAGLLVLPAVGVASTPQADEANGLQKLQMATGGKVETMRSKATGTARYVRATDGASFPVSGVMGDRSAKAIAFFTAYGDIFGVRDPQVELALKAQRDDGFGMGIAEYQQYYEGVPVYGGQLFVHFNRSGEITAVNGRFLPDLLLKAEPTISAGAAAQVALQAVAKGQLDTFEAGTPELYIYHPGLVQDQQAVARLAYRVSVGNHADTFKYVFVDAELGVALATFDGIYTDGATPTGLQRITLDMNHRTDYSTAVPCRTEDGRPSIYLDCNLAHDYAGDTYNFYFNAYGRDSLDGQGLVLRSYVHFAPFYLNANWNNQLQAMTYGSGMAVDDVVAHELTHGLTHFTSDLIYQYQPGALNESFSDIFGETVDLLNNSGKDTAAVRWLIGEDLRGLGAGRNMANPNQFNNPASTTDSMYYCGSGDNGGVHLNSGVPNKLFSLLVDGGNLNDQDVPSIGLIKAAAIHYRALDNYSQVFTDFRDHAANLASSCSDLMGIELADPLTGEPSGETISEADCESVAAAVMAVGLNGDVCLNVADENPPPLCEGGTPTFHFDDDQESDSGWMAEPGATNIINWAKVAVEGRGQVWKVDDTTNLSCDPSFDASAEAMLTTPEISIPAGTVSVTLNFEHYYGVEGYWDGGVVEYSVDGGEFMQLPAERFWINGYNEVIFPIIGGNTNPLAYPDVVRSAFTGFNRPGRFPEPGYLHSRADLSGLVSGGQTVRLRFHFGQDYCNGLDGWYVDTVQVYTCAVGSAAE